MGLDCIILAAGAATRFGSCKLLADYRGQPLIAQAIQAAKILAPERILLVTGAAHELLDTYRASLPEPVFELVYCADWHAGMGYSLACGVNQLNSDQPVLVLLGDQPRISAEDVQRLYRLWRANQDYIVCARFADTLGVPAIFPAAFKMHLRNGAGERGAKQLLFNHAAQVLALDMPTAEFDVDTPADLQRELAAAKTEF